MWVAVSFRTAIHCNYSKLHKLMPFCLELNGEYFDEGFIALQIFFFLDMDFVKLEKCKLCDTLRVDLS